jgi:hypothetical protein
MWKFPTLKGTLRRYYPLDFEGDKISNSDSNISLLALILEELRIHIIMLANGRLRLVMG